MEIKCFDVASISIEGATESFKPDWKLNSTKLKIFESYCSSCDKIIREFDGLSFEFDVDNETKDIIISMSFEQISIGGKNHYLYELFRNAKNCVVDMLDDNSGCFKITMSFPPIWDCVKTE